MVTTVNANATDAAYVRYVESLANGDAFRNHERSHASRTFMQRGCGWMKQADENTGKLLVALGKLATTYRSLMPVALHVARSVNPHAARGEWEARLFSSALEALSKGFDDVEKRSGPESYRFSECQRDYTPREYFVTLELLASVCDGWMGLGWCAVRFAQENNIQIRDHEDYFSKSTRKVLSLHS